MQYLDYINVMAYDVFWSGYNFGMDIEALQSIGISKEHLHLSLAKSLWWAKTIKEARESQIEFSKVFGLKIGKKMHYIIQLGQLYTKWPKCIQSVSKIYPKCIRNVSKIRPKCILNVSKMCSKCVQNASKMYLKCIQNVS